MHLPDFRLFAVNRMFDIQNFILPTKVGGGHRRDQELFWEALASGGSRPGLPGLEPWSDFSLDPPLALASPASVDSPLEKDSVE